jgi:hypothetical protein
MTCFDEEPEHQPTKEEWDAYEAKRTCTTQKAVARALEAIDFRISEAKVDIPFVIPSAAKNREMYNERRQGFISGLMVASLLLTKEIGGADCSVCAENHDDGVPLVCETGDGV